MDKNKIIDDLSEFLLKYKHHVEYSDRSIGIKILESTLKLLKNLNEENNILKDKNLNLTDQLKELNKEFLNVKNEYNEKMHLLADNFNSLIKVMEKEKNEKEFEIFLPLVEKISNLF